MKQWNDDKKWSDRFLPEIKSILGIVLIGEPPIEEDQERNTDLIVLKMDSVRIACRVRRPKFIKNKTDFTIRSGRPSGIKTELTKIIEGWGDYLFYAISDDCEKALLYWFIGNLNVFRLWFNRQIIRNGKIPGITIPNKDKSSDFIVFAIGNLPSEFIIKSNHNPYEKKTKKG